MAANALAGSDIAYPGYGVPNALNANGSFAGGNPVAVENPIDKFTAASNYPSWYTDPGARGLGTDWAPAAHAQVTPMVFTPRNIPVPVQEPANNGPASTTATVQPTAPLDGEAFSGVSGGSEGGGGETDGGSGGGGSSDDGGVSGAAEAAANDAANAGDAAAAGAAAADSAANAAADSTSAAAGEGASGAADASAAADAAGDSAGASAGFFKGGIVTKNKLIGPNPHGPDDGFGPLNKGEGVLTAKAVSFYGRGMVAKLNKLMVPKEALR